MKLFYSPSSPFVRKVMVCAIELGIEGKLDKEATAVGPIDRNQAVIPSNPLAQVPTLITDDGMPLYDSRVICEYLDSIGGNKLFPAPGPARWRTLTEQTAADGLLDAALLGRYEITARPEDKRYEPWRLGQLDKIRTALNQFVTWLPAIGSRVDIGTITIGCALGYLDFRYADFGWRNGRQGLADWYANFATRPSMEQTKPPAG